MMNVNPDCSEVQDFYSAAGDIMSGISKGIIPMTASNLLQKEEAWEKEHLVCCSSCFEYLN